VPTPITALSVLRIAMIDGSSTTIPALHETSVFAVPRSIARSARRAQYGRCWNQGSKSRATPNRQ